MASAVVRTSEKIVLNFAWAGPNVWRGGCFRGGLDVQVVDLVFSGAKTDISVHLPENINPVVPQKFSFTCRKYHETETKFADRPFKLLAKETHPDSLHVTIEQIRNLTIKAGFFERGRSMGPRVMDSLGKISQQETILRSDRDVRLEIPEELEPGQIYRLVVSSDDLSLSARLVKEGVIGRSREEEKASESASDLDKLSVTELQSRFEVTFKQDKEFESQRMRAAIAGDMSGIGRILEAEAANSQLLINLAKALERKGVKPRMPQSDTCTIC